MSTPRPILALTQGDPAGIGPEILVKLLQDSWIDRPWTPLLVAERAALEALQPQMPTFPWERLAYFSSPPDRRRLESLEDEIAVLDPVAERRTVTPGQSGPADAAGALTALDAAVAATRTGLADAVVTAPVSKSSIATHHRPDFTGHTEYLAAEADLEEYGRDYLMAFLSPDLQVALLSTHLPLREALDQVRSETILDALRCLGRHAPGRIAVAGLNPHAGEGGLLGSEDEEEIAPAVQAARELGLTVDGPLSADSLFARARRGAFDWVLALYHDQGLIAVKTAAFGRATNWTLGLPYLRTSVDHGTAFDLAGKGLADHRPLEAVIQTTLKLLSGELPRS
ncbi:MAG: 4-hydroxythreonine-4-phosphate dehydrogenase PdxA [Acidobacteriota bacterium]|nr:4-hydroxythreonine-4-phosphate dehydrogenase PdxA [Acidobacteriota bacterium]